MPITPISVHVLRAGERADELLAAAALAVSGNPDFRPESTADPIVRFLVDLPARQAYELVVGALEKAGDDWDEHLLVNPPA